MRIIEALYNTLSRTRRVGSTTACIEGLKSVGGGTLIVPYEASNKVPGIEFISLDRAEHCFIAQDKPVLIDPGALALMLKNIKEERYLADVKTTRVLKRIEKDLEELKTI